jgi:cytidylate kinase
MKQNGLGEKEAIKRIEKIDKYRADYYHYYTGGDWNDARNYNFCLDTTSMSYEKLVEVVENFITTYQK